MRRGALLKEAQNIGMSPTLVAGGEKALGNCEESDGFWGPGSVKLDGLAVVFIWPCGGSSGFPKRGAALAAAAAVATVPAAAAASTRRRDTVSINLSFFGRLNPSAAAARNR
jgi:hypothetical protein